MIIIIIAGGSGTRLWPLSTPDYPKHLLKVNNDERSLLQKTYDRSILVTDKIYVITEKSHSEEVKKQLGELSKGNIIIEPGRRGTANCIIQALVKIQRIEDPNEPVAFIHADHYVRDSKGFRNNFEQINRISQDLDRLMLVGVEPDYPATGFGYIKKGEIIDGQGHLYNVEDFKEKPDYPTANSYFKSGDYLWNCGYFVASTSLFIKLIKDYAPELHHSYKNLQASMNNDSFDEVYLKLKSDAIDYALIEKIPNLAVYPANFDWMDLGSYRDLSIAAGGDEKENSISGKVYDYEVENSFIQNEENKPVVVIGMDNVVVVNTKNGVLVARKDLSQKVGDIAKQINKDNS